MLRVSKKITFFVGGSEFHDDDDDDDDDHSVGISIENRKQLSTIRRVC